MQESIPAAKTFYPSIVQFQDPIAYIESIAEEGAKYGACKIVPPREWQPQIHRPAHLIATRQQKVHFNPSISFQLLHLRRWDAPSARVIFFSSLDASRWPWL